MFCIQRGRGDLFMTSSLDRQDHKFKEAYGLSGVYAAQLSDYLVNMKSYSKPMCPQRRHGFFINMRA